MIPEVLERFIQRIPAANNSRHPFLDPPERLQAKHMLMNLPKVDIDRTSKSDESYHYVLTFTIQRSDAWWDIRHPPFQLILATQIGGI